MYGFPQSVLACAIATHRSERRWPGPCLSRIPISRLLDKDPSNCSSTVRACRWDVAGGFDTAPGEDWPFCTNQLPVPDVPASASSGTRHSWDLRTDLECLLPLIIKAPEWEGTQGRTMLCRTSARQHVSSDCGRNVSAFSIDSQCVGSRTSSPPAIYRISRLHISRELDDPFNTARTPSTSHEDPSSPYAGARSRCHESR